MVEDQSHVHWELFGISSHRFRFFLLDWICLVDLIVVTLTFHIYNGRCLQRRNKSGKSSSYGASTAILNLLEDTRSWWKNTRYLNKHIFSKPVYKKNYVTNKPIFQGNAERVHWYVVQLRTKKTLAIDRCSLKAKRVPFWSKTGKQ